MNKKKILLGLVAVAAMGVSVLSVKETKAPLLLTKNVDALAQSEELDYFCALSLNEYCEYVFEDETIPCPDTVRDDL